MYQELFHFGKVTPLLADVSNRHCSFSFSFSPGGRILALKGNFFMSFLLPILSRY